MVILPFAPSTTALAQDAPVTECDRYAASDQDPQRKTAGIPLDAVNPALAVPACEAAVRQYPNSSGLAFQLGRALYKANNFAAAVVQVRRAADQGYIAQNDLGAMYESGQGVALDYAQALAWYRKAAAQGIERAQANVRRLSPEDHPMDATALALAMAYSAYCGPLPEDVRTKVDNAMQTMTPDQRWLIEHQAGDIARGTGLTRYSNLLNYPPSVREGLAYAHKVTCDQLRFGTP